MGKMTLINNHKTGYIALSSVLVISAVVLIVGVSVTLLSISEAQISLGGRKSEASVDFVEGCVEEALLRLNEDNSVPTTIGLPQGQCSVTIDGHVGDDWILTVSGSLDGYYHSIQVVANRSSTVTITSWGEVE